MNHNVGENRKLFRKEMSRANGGRMENCSTLKHRGGRQCEIIMYEILGRNICEL